MALYLEDFAAGQPFLSGSATVKPEAVARFATEFDPQPFHLDADAAKESLFRGLAASGWHTAAMTMRLLVECEMKPAGGIIGAGFEELRWPKPVRPGDTLRLTSEVLEVRRLSSRPTQGIIKVRTVTLNQHDEPVQIMVGNHTIAFDHAVAVRILSGGGPKTIKRRTASTPSLSMILQIELRQSETPDSEQATLPKAASSPITLCDLPGVQNSPPLATQI
ncbi:MaoC family dehydratase [Aminobacter sp. BA135]|uniref:MaoC family dehydratase n=1 Tax=Aminobacter sp. BA135 TaxID=537596 RepID=UPI003D7A17A9